MKSQMERTADLHAFIKALGLNTPSEIIVADNSILGLEALRLITRRAFGETSPCDACMHGLVHSTALLIAKSAEGSCPDKPCPGITMPVATHISQGTPLGDLRDYGAPMADLLLLSQHCPEPLAMDIRFLLLKWEALVQL